MSAGEDGEFDVIFVSVDNLVVFLLPLSFPIYMGIRKSENVN